ncbi:PLP-dependent aminotransferase family protein [Streptomyces sp. NPDC026672]|uniref:aminotransferase-like domain-containing protein n=1 Tax=unclassified Streptomyces TaxID=2593676 RepID=UPI0033E5D8D7
MNAAKDYRNVADEVAASITAGTLRPGDRLPPQRDFARRHGIADSTAARVYRELGRRGLTVGEVGRGTFVRATAPAVAPALTEPAAGRIDLELNYPVVPGQSALLADGLAGLLRPDTLAGALRPVGATGTAAARDSAAGLLTRGDWRPDPERVLFAGNGRQAVSAALAALVPRGGRLGVEELTYPVVKAVAARLGITLVPLALDGAGLVPEALARAHAETPLDAVYVQPRLHNPLALSMPAHRVEELAGVLLRLGLPVVEDAVWSFLHDDLPPLAAYVPERTVLIDSLSKRVAPGLTVGFAVTPAALAGDVTAALRSGGWTPAGYALEAMDRWQRAGTLRALTEAKQRDAAHRQRLAARHLADFTVRTDPRSYHCWWELPPPWRADTFVAAAARQGIAVVPSAAFTASPHQAPNAVRLGLATPHPDTLDRALTTLTALARSRPEDLVAD